MEQAKISVIMPVYNGERYLREAIDSILGQTYADFEFIILDDGSSDSSADIVRGYDDPRIRFVQNEKNMGVAATLNRGLDLARGEYIARMDADDISLPSRFERQLEYMESHPKVAVCGCGTQVVDSLGKPIVSAKKRVWSKNVGVRRPEQMKVDMLFSCGLAHPTAMMRGSVFGKDGLRYDPAFSKMEDYALWVRTMERHDIACIPDVLFQYRIHAGQVTQNPTQENIVQRRKLKELQMEQLGLRGEGPGFEALLKGWKNVSKTEAQYLFEQFRRICNANKEAGVYDQMILKKYLEVVFFAVLNRFPWETAKEIAGSCGLSVTMYGLRRLKGVGAKMLRNALTNRK